MRVVVVVAAMLFCAPVFAQGVKLPSVTNSIGMELIEIPAGNFTMGSPRSEKNHKDREAQVFVTLTKPFRLGKTEVTQGQWKSVMDLEPWLNKSDVRISEDNAANYVSWDDATEFCKKLTDLERKARTLQADEEYRLPTEAEWEYACRAGTTTAFSFGDDESKFGEYAARFPPIIKTEDEFYSKKVGTKKPNPWGLYDMHGNVCELCSDRFGEKLSGGTDPAGPDEGSNRVWRGGSSGLAPGGCRSAIRASPKPSDSGSYLGFRVVRSQLVTVTQLVMEKPEPVKKVFKPGQTITNSIGMELIEIPLEKKSSESQQMLSIFLDEPWTKYETAIATAEKPRSTLPEAFMKQLEAAAALGSLELVEFIAAEQKEFERSGTLPSGESFRPIVQAIEENYGNANTQLIEAYRNAISDLTKQKRFAEARIVRDEMQLVFREAKLLRPNRTNGCFRMGDGAGVAVTLTKPFSLGKTEVTQGQWKSVMGTEPWSGEDFVKADKDCPATFVSWDEAIEFCQKLTANEHKNGNLPAGESYRLPTDAEWECACRAGTETAFSFGDDRSKLGEYAWFDGNTGSEQYAHKVGMKKLNPWGLHDMHGNVLEFCSDWYGDELSGGIDPIGPKGGSYRVFRGGCWGGDPGGCLSAHRYDVDPSNRDVSLGFRVARSQSVQ